MKNLKAKEGAMHSKSTEVQITEIADADAPNRKGVDRRRKRDSKRGIGVRFPSGLYEAVVAISTATGKPVNSILEEGFHYYFASYVNSADFLRRLTHDADSRAAALQRIRGNAEEPSEPTRAARSAASTGIVSTVVRVDPDVEFMLNDLKKVLGTSLNDAVCETTWVWTEKYPRSSLFAEEARALFSQQVRAVQRLEAPGVLDQYATVLDHSKGE